MCSSAGIHIVCTQSILCTLHENWIQHCRASSIIDEVTSRISLGYTQSTYKYTTTPVDLCIVEYVYWKVKNTIKPLAQWR